MATSKQIAANRANALRSTGPRTVEGKKAASRNAYKHGLSRANTIEDSQMLTALAMKIAEAIEGLQINVEPHVPVAQAFLEVERVRRVQAALLVSENALTNITVLKTLIATERYARRASTLRRRVIAELLGQKQEFKVDYPN
jgi:hypothetical protein